MNGFYRKGIISIADQALFAGSNFLLNILLARWLSQNDFGVFTTIYSWFFILLGIQTALFVDPLLVYGPGLYKDVFTNYIHHLIKINFLFIFISSIFIGILGCISTSIELRIGFFGLAISSMFILFQFLIRRTFYVISKPEISLIGGIIYSILLIFLLYISYRLKIASLFLAFIMIGLANLGSLIWFFYKLKSNFKSNTTFLSRNEILENHWRYGRWALATSILSWIPNNLFFSVLAFQGNFLENAALKAIMNTILPIQHSFNAITTVLVPDFVKVAIEKSVQGIRKAIVKPFLIFTIIAILYFIFLSIFKDWVLFLLYQDKYIIYAYLLPYVGIIPIFGAGFNVFTSALRALNRPKEIFWSYFFTSFFIISIGVYLVLTFGIIGAIISIIFSSALVFFFLFFFLFIFNR
ncbi:MAG TPA: hypothetical protein DCY12_01295 [Candidatus Atribacteria bacterium]|nr:hypothetical protein [Candidatus Atribacteria bacterium]